MGHAGHDEATGTLAVAPDAIRLVEDAPSLDRALAAVEDPSRVALLAQTTLSHREWSGFLEQSRERFPDLWTAGRDDLCFATTNRQAALDAIARRADAVVVIGSANSSNTLALVEVATDAGCRRVVRVDDPGEVDPEALGRPRVVGVTAGASAPEDLVAAVIARLAPTDGVEVVRITREDEYFPPPPELREAIPLLDAVAALALGADPDAARTLGGPFADDRTRKASEVLEALEA